MTFTPKSMVFKNVGPFAIPQTTVAAPFPVLDLSKVRTCADVFTAVEAAKAKAAERTLP